MNCQQALNKEKTTEIEVMKKIALIGSHARDMYLFRYDFIKSLQQDGFLVYLFCPENEIIFSLLKEKGVQCIPFNIHRTSLNLFKDMGAILKLFGKMRLYRFNTVILYGNKPILYGSFVAKFLKYSKIYSLFPGQGNFFSTQGYIRKILQKILIFNYKILLKSHKKIICLNLDDIISLQKKRIGTSSQYVHLNSEGINVNFFYHANFPSSNEKIIFLFVGRLLNDKGILEYIEAAKIIKNKYPNAIFKICGDLDENKSSLKAKELMQFIKDGFIEYVGYVNDIRLVLEQSHVLVLPSYYGEGIPRSILEAMAMGRPIITTNHVGCKETVKVDIMDFWFLFVTLKKFLSLWNTFCLTQKKFWKWVIIAERWPKTYLVQILLTCV